MPGTLYVVATPIGNLKDITLRALEVLQSVQCVACEDTRVTAVLLRHYGIDKPMVSYHRHNERRRAPELIRRLISGDSIALVSDAGTPSLSDPGAHLVSEALGEGIPCVPIPGPSALSAILAVAGQVPGPVVFIGFAPARAGERQKFLLQTQTPGAYCFYESPHRVLPFLRQMERHWDNPPVVLGRELTKLHEEILRGRASDLVAALAGRDRIRGEFVLLVQRSQARREGLDPVTASLHTEYEHLLAAGQDRKSALKLLGQRYGIARKELYRRLFQSESEAKNV